MTEYFACNVSREVSSLNVKELNHEVQSVCINSLERTNYFESKCLRFGGEWSRVALTYATCIAISVVTEKATVMFLHFT